jgi:hypothetical protein
MQAGRGWRASVRPLNKVLIVVLVSVIAVLAIAGLYVGTGDDVFWLGSDYVEARERLRLVFAALSALAAPVALWVALTAYQLNARLAELNTSARLDFVPETADHAVKRRVRYSDRTTTDVAGDTVQFTHNPVDSGRPPGSTLYCAVPFYNHGPSRATLVSTAAELPGFGAGKPRPAGTFVAADSVVFTTFVWKTGKVVALPSVGPTVTVRYLDGSGTEIKLTVTVEGDPSNESWELVSLEQSKR